MRNRIRCSNRSDQRVNSFAPEMLSDEEYANSYRYFVEALDILKMSALEQCQAMGFYNVAWELKDDVLRGAEAVTNLNGGHLSQTQTGAILSLADDVKSIPDQIFNVPSLRDAHLVAMNNPAWNPIRDRVKDLLALLGPETSRVYKLLGLELSQPSEGVQSI